MLLIAWGLFSLSSPSAKTPTEAQVQPIVRLPISPSFLPVRNWSVKEPEISARSGIIINFKPDGEEGNVLFQKNPDQVLPIASLTKIMTALIALENFNLDEVIKVSQNSVLTIGDKGNLIREEELTVKDLLYIMLIDSSNDAAMSLAGDNPRLPYNQFINLMNSKSEELGLKDTYFVDPIGLNSSNHSTVFDLAYLIKYSLKFPLIWEILKTPQIAIYSADNKFVHNLLNTNELLDKFSFLKGGKTGYTDEAGGCMLTVSDIAGSWGNNYLITVILGSEERTEDTEKLINWAKQAWIFSP
jgi:D-alanyl-D-alanine carboxypeptidase